jgi:hypothetical protein
MTTTRVFTLIAATILAAGAGSALAEPPRAPAAPVAPAAPSAPPGKTVSDAEAQRLVVFFDKLTSIAVASADDCTKMAAGFNTHIDANEALLKDARDAKSAGKELPPAIKEKIETKVQRELRPAVQKKCAGDRTVQTALVRILQGKPDKKDMDRRDMDRDHDGDRDHDKDKDKNKDKK